MNAESLLVKDWMTPDPIAVDPRTTLPAAYYLMKLNHVRRLPVIDDSGRVVGIVTLGDIREARPKESGRLNVWEIHFLAASLEVRDFMTPAPVTVTPETPVREAAKIMLDRKIGGLPVIVDGKLVGIVTESDLLRLIVERLLPEPAGELETTA